VSDIDENEEYDDELLKKLQTPEKKDV